MTSGRDTQLARRFAMDTLPGTFSATSTCVSPLQADIDAFRRAHLDLAQ